MVLWRTFSEQWHTSKLPELLSDQATKKITSLANFDKNCRKIYGLVQNFLHTVVYIQATSVLARENSKEEREGKTEKQELTLVSLRSANFCSSTSVSSRSCNVTSGTVEVTLSPEAAVSMVSDVRTSACAHPCLTSASITQPRFLSISLNMIWSIFYHRCVHVCARVCVHACVCDC